MRALNMTDPARNVINVKKKLELLPVCRYRRSFTVDFSIFYPLDLIFFQFKFIIKPN